VDESYSVPKHLHKDFLLANDVGLALSVDLIEVDVGSASEFIP
jgi:hypothetical protein